MEELVTIMTKPATLCHDGIQNWSVFFLKEPNTKDFYGRKTSQPLHAMVLNLLLFAKPVVRCLFRATIALLLVVLPTYLSVMTSPAVAQADSDGPSNQQSSSLSKAQLWALACPALLAELRQERHDLLGGCEPSPRNKARAQQVLREYWDVYTHDDLLKKIHWLESGGQRVEFSKFVQLLKLRGTPTYQQYVRRFEQSYGKEEFDRKMSVVSKSLPKLNGKTLIGWDYCRIISLSRWGYTFGIMSESEAWSKIMEAARMLQQNLSSWEDLGTNYMTGREFWSKQETDETGSAYDKNLRKLLTDPTSPWKTLPWNTSLR